MNTEEQSIIPPEHRADVLVLGGGASGLTCAAAAAMRGFDVMVLDRSTRAARKVLASGGGFCNVTNMNASDASHYISENPHFVRSALARFSPQDVLEMLQRHAIPYEEREEGRIFLRQSAAHLVEALLRDCDAAGVRRITGAEITTARAVDDGFAVNTTRGVFHGQRIVIATGGQSWQSLGATSTGYQLARGFGHAITELRPGLVPLLLPRRDNPFKGLSGVSFRATVSTSRKARSFTDDVLITHQGLSGPAILQISSFWRKGEPLTLNVLPGRDALQWLHEHRGGRMELKNLLSTLIPRRLAQGLAEICAPSGPMNALSDTELRRVADVVNAMTLTPTATEGFAAAEVTVGGVDTRQVSSKTMQSQITAGVYFTAEVLDVTGELGGYNLHWAWASAHAAAEGL